MFGFQLVSVSKFCSKTIVIRNKIDGIVLLMPASSSSALSSGDERPKRVKGHSEMSENVDAAPGKSKKRVNETAKRILLDWFDANEDVSWQSYFDTMDIIARSLVKPLRYRCEYRSCELSQIRKNCNGENTHNAQTVVHPHCQSLRTRAPKIFRIIMYSSSLL